MSLIAIGNTAAVVVNGRKWVAQTANKPDSLQVDSANPAGQMVFRTRCGENCPEAYDTPRRVRSELCSTTMIPAGPKLRGFFTFKRSGPLFRVEWNSMIQAHCQDSKSGSPAFQLGTVMQPDGIERVQVNIAYKRSTDSAIQYPPSIIGPAFIRDKPHTVDYSYIAGYGQNGYVSILFDGVSVANYWGPLGYAAAAPNTDYLKVGTHAGVERDGQFPVGWDQIDTMTGLNAGLAV